MNRVCNFDLACPSGRTFTPTSRRSPIRGEASRGFWELTGYLIILWNTLPIFRVFFVHFSRRYRNERAIWLHSCCKYTSNESALPFPALKMSLLLWFLIPMTIIAKKVHLTHFIRNLRTIILKFIKNILLCGNVILVFHLDFIVFRTEQRYAVTCLWIFQRRALGWRDRPRRRRTEDVALWPYLI